ncbi:MAG: glycine cleavage system aminomethyltransferase GcvT [Desulfarculus sp.]|nr:glycine cleavage system aminomethyltransferase GcvT [Desulfarculus sp.]
MTLETPLIAWHRQHGGRLVEFAGWSLPVSYQAGIIAEHLACRKSAALFDTSHMGRFRLEGPGALGFLQRALTNDAARLEPGRSHYTFLSDQDGRPLDDAYLLRLPGGAYLLVVNAGNRDQDWAWLQGLDATAAGLQDVSPQLAMLALQGPASTSVLGRVLGGQDLPRARNHCAWRGWAGGRVLVSRTGYTGEPHSYELFVDTPRVVELWEALLEAGAGLGLMAAGLGARDTLRLEAGLPLYGHELKPDWPILSLPLARHGVDLTTERGDFLGRAALERQAAELAGGQVQEVPCLIRGVAALERGMMREGSPVLVEGRPVGELTSGTTVPAWRFAGGVPGDEHYSRAIGLACLERQVADGQKVEIVYRGRALPGVIANHFVKRAGDYLRPLP